VIDTDMQAVSRTQEPELFPSVELFKGFHREGQLVAPELAAARIVDRLIVGEVEHGRTYSHREL
jgi:hypothetical protein